MRYRGRGLAWGDVCLCLSEAGERRWLQEVARPLGDPSSPCTLVLLQVPTPCCGEGRAFSRTTDPPTEDRQGIHRCMSRLGGTPTGPLRGNTRPARRSSPGSRFQSGETGVCSKRMDPKPHSDRAMVLEGAAVPRAGQPLSRDRHQGFPEEARVSPGGTESWRAVRRTQRGL